MTEDKIVKIIDKDTHSRGLSIEQVGEQGALIAKVVGTTLASGAATSANQDLEMALQNTLISSQATTNSLIETLQELSTRLSGLGGVMNTGVTGLRVVGVSMPSTAVTGPITTAQHLANTLTLRMAGENLTATIANINNCIGA